MDENLNNLFQNIINGEFDVNLSRLEAAISARKQALAVHKIFSFKVGDRVFYTGNVRPKYLSGKQGIITAISENKVVVKLDNPVGKFWGSAGIRTPVNLVEKVV